MSTSTLIFTGKFRLITNPEHTSPLKLIFSLLTWTYIAVSTSVFIAASISVFKGVTVPKFYSDIFYAPTSISWDIFDVL